jgi:hypothetical protein
MFKNNFMFNLIKSSIEYYDSYQPQIIDIINKIEYIKIKNNHNITDSVIFYDKNNKIIFESSFEVLSFYIPNTRVWKWAWSTPSAQKKSSIISRKILNYALELDHNKDFMLKTTLINSKIKIINNIQLDIYIALSASLSKKPFILKMYIIPPSGDDVTLNEFRINNDNKNIDKENYIVAYLFILDFVPNK